MDATMFVLVESSGATLVNGAVVEVTIWIYMTISHAFLPI